MHLTKRPRVSIAKGENVENIVRRAVDLVGHMNSLVRPGDKVLIKPNMAGPFPFGSGVCTNPRVIKGLIQMVIDVGGKPIVGDGTGAMAKYNTQTVYEISGVKQVAEELGAQLADFNSDEHVEVEVPDGRELKRVKISRTVLDSHVIINVPVMKTHTLTVVTLCLKNLMGCIPHREKSLILHPKTIVRDGIPGVDPSLYIPSQQIVDFNKLIKPALHFVDGTIGMEGLGPLFGNPVKMDLVIAGRDPVAVDAVTAAIMGFDPRRIDTICLAAIEGLGEIDLDNIEVVGESIQNVSRRFYLPSNIYQPYTWLLRERK